MITRPYAILSFCIAVALTLNASASDITVLRIGSTGTLTGKADSAQEKAGHEMLRRFVKEETGVSNEIIGQQKWSDLSDRLAKGDLHLGVFQGYEFAWAQERQPMLKALAVGVNGYHYPVAIVMAAKTSAIADFRGLKGQSLVTPSASQAFLTMFLSKRAIDEGSELAVFFPKMNTSETLEDSFDDVVDGKFQAVVVDQAALDAYKERKPGRFKQLKVIERSQPFPPIVIASYNAALDPATLAKFKKGLLTAASKEKGETLLTLSHLTAFENIPADFDQVLANTRKTYPKEIGK